MMIPRFRVATETTKFAMPEAGIGFFTDAGGGFFLPRLKPDGLGLYLALTGKILRGSDNIWSGFATHFIPHKKISEVRDVLTGLRFSPDDNVAAGILKVLDSYHDKSATAPSSLEPFMPLIGKLYGEGGVGVSGTMEQLIDMIKAALAAESKGTPIAQWLEEQLNKFEQSSPTSLKVILQQQQRGRKLSLVDVFKMEYRLSQRFSQGHDFPEGVRAALIDKDKSPKWKPSSLSEVTEDMLQSLFEPLSPIEEWSP
uniref:3-hydroxyisobutyryl-CoA hydrolase, mitochondrial n=1 Tax=Schistocephalus solidus TaxID=70667 RepID=A0A0X3PSW4_SCHSO